MSSAGSRDTRVARNAHERRLTPRVGARVDVQLLFDAGSLPLRARSCDIGTGGMCIETPHMLLVDSLRGVSFELPQRRLELAAEARWHRDDPAERGFLTGLRFTAPDAEATYCLWEFVQERASELAQFLRDDCDLELDLEEAMELAFFTRETEVPIGQKIFQPGRLPDRSETFFVLRRGRVSLGVEVSGGRGMQMECAQRGHIFGGLSLICGSGNRRDAAGGIVCAVAGGWIENAVAEDRVELLEIDSHAYRHLEAANPAVARRLAEAVTRNLGQRIDELIHRMAATG